MTNIKIKKVVFLVQYSLSWKCDTLYKKLLSDPHFEPFIVFTPSVYTTIPSSFTTISETENSKNLHNYFNNLNYTNLYSSYNEQEDRYMELHEIIDDIDIIYSNSPYSNQTLTKYSIDYLSNKYHVLYMTYGLSLGGNRIKYIFYNYEASALSSADIFLGESETIKQLALKFNENGKTFLKENVNNYTDDMVNKIITVGYPFLDDIDTKRSSISYDCWKNKNSKDIKRVIYAPHWTVRKNLPESRGDYLNFSDFLEYGEAILNLTKSYVNKIEFILRPHPLLKEALYQHEDWGQDKTDRYFEEWDKGVNTSTYLSGNYIDLFLSSDAMLNTGVSFMNEYAYVGKPQAYLRVEDSTQQRLIDSLDEEYGKQLFNASHHIRDIKELETFLQDVVLNGVDTKENLRAEYIKEHFTFENGLTPTDNIINVMQSINTKKDNINELSVFVPTYNDQEGIQDTLYDIVNQKINFSYKIVIVDNNSTDNTVKVVNDFIKCNQFNHIDISIIVNPQIISINQYNAYNFLKQVIANDHTKYIIIPMVNHKWADQNTIQHQHDKLTKTPNKIAFTYSFSAMFQSKFISELDLNDIPDIIFTPKLIRYIFNLYRKRLPANSISLDDNVPLCDLYTNLIMCCYCSSINREELINEYKFMNASIQRLLLTLEPNTIIDNIHKITSEEWTLISNFKQSDYYRSLITL